MAISDSRQDSAAPRPAVRTAHRLLGLSGACFLIVLVITGIAAQHPEAFNLDQRYIGSQLVLDWYGVRAPEVASVYLSNDDRYAQVGERIYRSGTRLAEPIGTLRGVSTAATADVPATVVATDRGVWLYDPSGAYIDRLDPPDPALRIGTDDDTLVLKTRQGTYRPDEALLNWIPIPAQAPRWASPRRPTAVEARSLQASYRAEVLTWEQLLLDLHSGRAFGPMGAFVIDAIALLLLITAITGLLLAIRPRPPSSRDI